MKQTIEQLAEQMVLADPGDLAGLANLHTLLEQVRSEAIEQDEPWTAKVCEAAAELIQSIILREVDDCIGALEEVAASVTVLQQCIVEKQDRSQVNLSPRIKLAVEGSTESESLTAQDLTNSSPSTGADDGANSASQAKAVPGAIESVLTGDLELTAEFVAEAREHLDAAEEHLLTIESSPADSDAVNGLFRAFHTIKGVSGFLDLHAIQALAHQTENLLDAARQNRIRLEGDCLEAVFEATDMMKSLVKLVAEALSTGDALKADMNQPALVARLGTLLLHSDGKASEPQAAPQPAALPDSPPCEPDALSEVSSDEHAAATSGQGQARSRVEVRETVKVDSARLDALVDSIGELVIAEAMVTQSPALRGLHDEAMSGRLTQLSKITRELQEMATSLRMVPIRSTFQRMARLARDTAKKIDKRIEFVTTGEQTELDKNVVDRIGDPLVHMVRNAVDHGIENSEQQRVEAGKLPVGRVELCAFHRGGSIYVQIADDGGGLDRERILVKARERGLVREDEKLSDAEVYQLIMEPGFSTAAQVSDVSGRGVGMDVVKRNIQAMRGQLEITSRPGQGTTFSIRLPLTLAIIDGMVLRVGDRRYALPLLSIKRMLRPQEHDVPTVFGQAEMLQTDEGLIPLYRVNEFFDIPGAQTDPSRGAVVVVEHDSKRVGLLVDELLGQQQIVIKSLGESLRGAAGVAGGAIMPDGRVGLILDLDSLIRLASTQTTRKPAA